MMRCLREPAVLALCVALTSGAVAPSQSDPLPLPLPRASAPPVIEPPTLTSQLIETVHAEAAELSQRERGKPEAQRRLIRASVNYRITAVELLSRGEAAGEGGAVSLLMGLTLARGRKELDEALRQLAARADADDPAVAAELRAAYESLRRFNAAAVDLAETIRTVDVDQLDTHLPRILTPLAAALGATAASGMPGSYWPAPVGEAAAGDDALPALRARLETASFDDGMLSVVQGILDYLERGARFTELRGQVARARRRVSRALDFADELAAAGWMDDGDRAGYTARLGAALTLFADTATRARGDAALDELESLRGMIKRLTTLADLRGPVREPAAVLVALDPPAGVEPRPLASPARLAVLDEVLDRMVAFRSLAPDTLPREYLVPMRKLSQEYRRAEDTLLDALDRLASDPRATSDPAFMSLLADQRQYLEDVQRARLAPAWIARIGAVQPDASAVFARQLRRLVGHLLDRSRRPDTLLAMDRLEDQIARFVPMPFEDALTAAEPFALEATGGMHLELLLVIGERRKAWIQAWGRGETDGPATEQAETLWRLMRAMADCAPLLREGIDVALLNRWAAWETPDGVLARTRADVPGRLKLATAAVVRGEERTLQSQLEHLTRDAPLVRLVGRLSVTLDPELSARPGGAVAVLGQLMLPPADDAIFIKQRFRLAELCHFAFEVEGARSRGEKEMADALRAHVNAIAESILERIDG